MTRKPALVQTALFEAGDELALGEALANARRALAAGGDTIHGGPRNDQAHLPPDSGGPELYALCPGCQVHPAGGIFPAGQLVRAEGCPAGRRLAEALAAKRTFTGEDECRRAAWEGAARSGPEGRTTPFPSASPELSRRAGRAAAGRGGAGPRLTRALRFSLTAPWRLWSAWVADAERRLRRAWYFHGRRATCRRRLSRIASAPSWNT